MYNARSSQSFCFVLSFSLSLFSLSSLRTTYLPSSLELQSSRFSVYVTSILVVPPLLVFSHLLGRSPSETLPSSLDCQPPQRIYQGNDSSFFLSFPLSFFVSPLRTSSIPRPGSSFFSTPPSPISIASTSSPTNPLTLLPLLVDARLSLGYAYFHVSCSHSPFLKRETEREKDVSLPPTSCFAKAIPGERDREKGRIDGDTALPLISLFLSLSISLSLLSFFLSLEL